MVKSIHYPLSEDIRNTYVDITQTSEEQSAFEDQIEDIFLLSAFQDLGKTAEGYIEYTNEYGSVEDWLETRFDDDDFFQRLNHVCEGYVKHKHQKTSADGEFFKLMRAGLKSTAHTYNPPSAKGEFFEMAKAGMRSMKYAYNPPPVNLLSYPPPPDALQRVYRHMGYPPIEDIVFLDMAASFENAYFSRAWSESHNWTESWDDDVFCDCCQDPYWSTPDILDHRDVPTAVTYMYQTTNGLGRIEDLVIWDLVETLEQYMEYTNSFDDWNDPKVAAFREFSTVANYVSYVCPDYQRFQQFLDLPAELREGIMHAYLLLERDAGRLSEHQHYDEFSNPCCMWEYPEMLVACDNQNTRVFPKASTGRCPKG